MELTKSEMEIADRHLAKRERELAQWPRRRWVMLAVYSVFMLVGALIVMDGKRSIYDDQNMEAEFRHALGKEGPPPGMEERWLMGSILKIGNVMEVRHQIVTVSLLQMAVGCLPFVSGLGHLVPLFASVAQSSAHTLAQSSTKPLCFRAFGLLFTGTATV